MLLIGAVTQVSIKRIEPIRPSFSKVVIVMINHHFTEVPRQKTRQIDTLFPTAKTKTGASVMAKNYHVIKFQENRRSVTRIHDKNNNKTFSGKIFL